VLNGPIRSIFAVALLLPGAAGADSRPVQAKEGSPPKAEARAKATPPKAGDARTNAKDGLKYVWIPAGSFKMGCVPGDSECDDSEKPRHLVTLSRGYWLGQTLVTVAAYKRFASVTGRAMAPPPSFNANWSLEDHPIVNVTWDDAVAYCEWSGGRLPTEAEWEYAARGGKDGLKYPWGDTLTHERANYGKEELEGQTQCCGLASGRDQWVNTSPVGSFDANAYGLYDMVGNAWAWCSDYAGSSYSAESLRDPKGAANDSTRVIRGGSWADGPRILRVSLRGRDAPSSRAKYFGFRCAQDTPSSRGPG